MKPAPFSYHSPKTLPETVGMLAEFGDQGRVLAGGQSLIPLMNFRLAQPAHLVDVNPVSELDYIRRDDGWLAIGARARLAAVEASTEVAERAPLLLEAVRLVAHPPIRHRATVCGSVAHADPAAELPAVALAMDAEMVLASTRGSRRLPAAAFFQGPFTTALEADELLSECRFQAWPLAGTGFAVLEFSRTHGNFAVAGAAALVHLDGELVDRAAIALFGVGGKPARATRSEERLVGNPPMAEAVEAAAASAIDGLEPVSDIHAGAGYRSQLARVYVRRALDLAVARAKSAEATGGR